MSAPLGRAAWIAAALVALALPACRSAEEAPERERAYPAEFALQERRPGGSTAGDLASTLVDYDSEVYVLPDRARLSELAAGLAGRGASRAVRVRADRVVVLADNAARTLRAIEDYERLAAEFWARERPAGPLRDAPGWSALKAAEQRVVDALDALAFGYVSLVHYGGDWDWLAEPDEMGIPVEEIEPALDRANAVYARLAPIVAGADGGRRVAFVPEEVTRVVNATTEALEAQVAEIERRVRDEAPSAVVGMRAELRRGGDERLEIGVSPYTEAAGVGRVGKSKRVGFPSPDQLAELERGRSALADVADASNAVIALAEDDAARAAAIDGARAAVEEALGAAAGTLVDQLDALARGDGAPFADVRAAAEALERDVRERVDAVRALLDAAESGDALIVLRRADAALAALDPEGLAAGWGRLVDAVDAAGADGLAAATVAGDAALAAAFGAFERALADDPAVAAVGDLVDALRALRSAAADRSFGDLEPGEVSRRAFSLDVAPDGLVDLAQTPADDGDELVLTYSLTVDDGPDGAEPTTYARSAVLGVRKYGWYTTYTAQLVFYRDLHGRTGSFRAAPAVAVNLHWRPARSGATWDVFSPALGLAVITPSLEDGTELAVGAQVTVLNDFLQVGWAYDVSVDSDPWLFYFGLDLISAVGALD